MYEINIYKIDIIKETELAIFKHPNFIYPYQIQALYHELSIDIHNFINISDIYTLIQNYILLFPSNTFKDYIINSELVTTILIKLQQEIFYKSLFIQLIMLLIEYIDYIIYKSKIKSLNVNYYLQQIISIHYSLNQLIQHQLHYNTLLLPLYLDGISFVLINIFAIKYKLWFSIHKLATIGLYSIITLIKDIFSGYNQQFTIPYKDIQAYHQTSSTYNTYDTIINLLSQYKQQQQDQIQKKKKKKKLV